MQSYFLRASPRRGRVIQGDIAEGIDPALGRKKEVARHIMSLAGLIEDWQTLHLKNRSLNYRSNAVRMLRRMFRFALDAPASALTRAEIIAVVDDLARRDKPAMATQVAACGSAAFSWAIRRGTVEIVTNPFARLPVAPATKRDRVLSDDELVAIWRATDGPGPFDRIVRLLILTAQRREEVADMRWEELSGDLTTWVIPATRTKNRTAHIVPLAEPARVILREIPRDGDFVFGPHGRPFNNFTRAKRALDLKSGVIGWRLHDLRRSTATNLQKLGVRA